MRFLILMFVTIITGSPAIADGLPANPWTHHTTQSSDTSVQNVNISETPQTTANSIEVEITGKQSSLSWHKLEDSETAYSTPQLEMPQINLPNITEMLPSAHKLGKNNIKKHKSDTTGQTQKEYQKYKRKASDKYNSAKNTTSKYYHKAKDSLQNWQKSVKNLGKSFKK